MTGTAPHHFVTVDDAIGDLPRFNWWARLDNLTKYHLPFSFAGRIQGRNALVERTIGSMNFHQSSVTIS
jgi:hypothetical protein